MKIESPKRFSNTNFIKGLLLGGIIAFVSFLLVDTDNVVTIPVTSADTAIVDQIDFTMGTRLGTGQVEEHIEVFLNDELVGVLHITKDNPIDTLELEVPEEGVYEYRINSVTWMEASNGLVYNFTGRGTGTIDVQEGDHFSAYYNNNSAIWQMSFLEE